MYVRLLAGVAAFVALPAFAQPPASAPTVGPAASAPAIAAPPSAPTVGPAASAPAIAAPPSALRDYRPWREPEPLSWRAANDTAAALGGHMGQLRGRPVSPPPSDRSAPPTTKDAAPRAEGSK